MRKVVLTVAILSGVCGTLRAGPSQLVVYEQTVLSLVVLAIVLGIGLLALQYNYRHHYRGPDKFWRFAWKNPIAKLAVFAIGLVGLCSTLLPRQDFSDPWTKVSFAHYRSQPLLAMDGYRELTERFPGIVRYHYEYVIASYEQDSWGRNRSVARLDPVTGENPTARYSSLFMHNTKRYLVDISLLGMGMANYFESQYQLAETQLRLIKNKDMPFRNFFLGRVAAKAGEFEGAEYFFQRELEIGTDAKLVVPELARTYFQQDNVVAMGKLVADPAYSSVLPVYFKRYYYTEIAELEPYLLAILGEWWAGIRTIGFVGAFGGLLIWFFFLRKIDLYKRTPVFRQIAVLLLGMVSTFMAMPFYDFLGFELNFGLTGSPWHDFLYCVAGIGLVEELVKILPFLFILYFSNWIRGPLDCIVYAALSGLGFAFVENLIYFDSGSVGIMHGRVIVTTVFHMVATSTVAYGWVLGKYRFGKYRIPLLLGGFLVAALFHGFYDFWLLNRVASAFFFLAYLVFIASTFLFAGYINNSLNNSPVFRGRVVLDTNSLAVYLLVALVLLLLFEYLCLALVYGVQIANPALFRSLGMGGFLMFFVVLNLSYIDIVQGEWFSVRLWNFSSRQNFNRAIGQRITLSPARKNSVFSRYLPAQGEIIARLKLRNDNRFFLLEFDETIRIGNHQLDHILIRSRDKHAVIEPGHKTEVAVVIFRGKEALLKSQKDGRDFKLLDYAVVR